MKAFKFSTVMAIAAFTFTGCFGISDVSNHPAFGSVIGQTLKTQRPTVLVRDRRSTTTSEDLVSGGHPVLLLYDLRFGKSGENWKKRVAYIPAGQPIRILKVQRQIGDGDFVDTAIGDVFVPESGKFVRFLYDWGYTDKLERAPWEPNSVPATRLSR